MRISDWSSDVCSSDLILGKDQEIAGLGLRSLEQRNAASAAAAPFGSIFVARRTEKVEDGCRAFRFARPHAFIHVLKSEVLAGGRFRIPANKADDREHWLDDRKSVV